MKKKVIAIFFATLTLASFAVAQKRSITEKDMFDFVWIGDPQVLISVPVRSGTFAVIALIAAPRNPK